MEKVLVVVDMQNDFIDGSLGTKEAVVIIDNVVKKIKLFNGKIFATLDTHYRNYLSTLEGKNLPVEHCIKMTDGWLLNDLVLSALSEKDYKCIEKETFGSTKLVDEIQKLKTISDIEVELVGLCSDICVVSNALLLKANFPEMDILVNAKCCAGVTPELHMAALATMKSCQINVIGE